MKIKESGMIGYKVSEEAESFFNNVYVSVKPVQYKGNVRYEGKRIFRLDEEKLYKHSYINQIKNISDEFYRECDVLCKSDSLSPKGNKYADKGVIELNKKALAYEKKGDNDQAIKYYKKGDKNANKGDYSQAIEYYKKALKIDPDYRDAWYNLGFAYIQKGDYNQAIECNKKALKIDHNFASAWDNMGIAYGKKVIINKK
jgi:tetratricopeptide (TPR) repeat protein